MKKTLLFIFFLLTGTACFQPPVSNSNQGNLNQNVNRKIEREEPEETVSDLVITTKSLPDAVVGKEYMVSISGANLRTPVGGASITDGKLPEGLSVGKADVAVISGTPKKAGKYKFTISVWCYGTQVSGQTASKEFELTVREK